MGNKPIVVGPSHDTKCPYFHRTAQKQVIEIIETREDFQIEINGKIGRVSLGEFDTVKEVNSHNGEVGLVNAIKLATARGIDPSTFAKTEPGLMVDLSDINTVDDLLKKQQVANDKLAEMAKTLGITPEELVEAVKQGDMSKLTPKHEEGSSEGGQE